MRVEGVRYGPVEATLDSEKGANQWLTIGIREGKNREVRNVLAHIGLTVNRLIRISFGPFELGDIREGTVEEVPTRLLREQLGGELEKLSQSDFDAPVREAPRPVSQKPTRDFREKREIRTEYKSKKFERDGGNSKTFVRSSDKPKKFERGDGSKRFELGDKAKKFDRGSEKLRRFERDRNEKPSGKPKSGVFQPRSNPDNPDKNPVRRSGKRTPFRAPKGTR